MEQEHSGSSCNGSAESLGSVQPLLDLEAACGAGSGMAPSPFLAELWPHP